jgi:CRISPR-associated protein Cas5d
MPIRLEVWGDYACFTNPALKVERVSYDVMTPSAARGILEAIFWHPGMKWVIDRIHVLAPIKFVNIKRNEVDGVISRNTIAAMMRGKKMNNVIYTSESIQQRATTMLQDVHYVIDAHFGMTAKKAENDTPAKFQSIFNRRAERGQCFHEPYFGCREFPVKFRLWEENKPPQGFEHGTRELGYMLYDLDYTNLGDPHPQFFRAQLIDGVLDVTDIEVHS